MPGADSGSKKFLRQFRVARRMSGTGRNRCRRVQMPARLGGDFCAQAEQAEHEKDIFDICHLQICFIQGGSARGNGLPRPIGFGAYQEMPYRAAIRRAFASSLSKRRA